MMRILGLCLLVAGFMVLLGMAFWIETTDIDIFAEAYDSVPQEQTFTRKEVQERLEALFERMHYRHVHWLVIPAFLMLGGGLMILKRPKSPPNQNI
jgi:hypothetical protein